MYGDLLEDGRIRYSGFNSKNLDTVYFTHPTGFNNWATKLIDPSYNKVLYSFFLVANID